VTRGVLDGEISFPRRRRALQQIGFVIEDRISSVIPAVIFVELVVSICSWLWLQAFGVSVAGNTGVGSAKILTVGALNLLLNVVLVQYAKQNFAFANPDIIGKRPWLFIFTIGLVTTTIVAVVRIVFEYFEFGTEVNSVFSFMERVTHSLPWSLNVWATGTIIALLSLDTTWNAISSPWLRRALDGAVLGAGWVAALLVVFVIGRYFRVEGLGPVSLYLVILTTFSFGFLIGFAILSGMRDPPLDSTGVSLAEGASKSFGPSAATGASAAY
jgi:hypothetical protein